MRLPRRSLCFLFAAFTAHATKPACDLLLEIRFDRPTAPKAAAPIDFGLKIDLADLTLSPALAQAARLSLQDLDPTLVARVLNKANATEQTDAFRLLFEWIDLSFLAREHRVTAATLIGEAIVLADRTTLFEGARRAVAHLTSTELRARAPGQLRGRGRGARRRSFAHARERCVEARRASERVDDPA